VRAASGRVREESLLGGHRETTNDLSHPRRRPTAPTSWVRGTRHGPGVTWPVEAAAPSRCGSRSPGLRPVRVSPPPLRPQRRDGPATALPATAAHRRWPQGAAPRSVAADGVVSRWPGCLARVQWRWRARPRSRGDAAARSAAELVELGSSLDVLGSAARVPHLFPGYSVKSPLSRSRSSKSRYA
jgi:hypothetical protein